MLKIKESIVEIDWSCTAITNRQIIENLAKLVCRYVAQQNSGQEQRLIRISRIYRNQQMNPSYSHLYMGICLEYDPVSSSQIRFLESNL